MGVLVVPFAAVVDILRSSVTAELLGTLDHHHETTVDLEIISHEYNNQEVAHLEDATTDLHMVAHKMDATHRIVFSHKLDAIDAANMTISLELSKQDTTGRTSTRTTSPLGQLHGFKYSRIPKERRR